MLTALRLARHQRGRLHPVHALEPPPLPFGATGFGLALPYLTTLARGRLREQLDRVGAQACEVAGDTVAAGSPGPVIRAAAETLDAALVVVAAAAGEPLPLHRRRSTVPDLLRRGRRPVVIVRGEMRVPPRRVLALVDRTSSMGALCLGLALVSRDAETRAIEVVAMHVIPAGREEGIACRSLLDRALAERVVDRRGRFRREARQGDAATEILAACARDRPDLVIVGSHEESKCKRWCLRGLAERVALCAPCAVLVVPNVVRQPGALADPRAY